MCGILTFSNTPGEMGLVALITSRHGPVAPSHLLRWSPLTSSNPSVAIGVITARDAISRGWGAGRKRLIHSRYG
ncbi:hypothetical protein FYJ43_01590 [Cutibacterium sp. WCA-380-WT-3A]|uniref:Uncharacterized protein n=1 Tax=Cutibacterium porci TaxID=2605781 RepID=A0A7K0J4C7_9ACTN|nr:hypothetical protein [Cutibacterium porci]